MFNVILEVKKLVSEETFKELKNELHTYEDWESVYDEILKEIEEEELQNSDHDSEKNDWLAQSSKTKKDTQWVSFALE